jgi:hypothetical protein
MYKIFGLLFLTSSLSFGQSPIQVDSLIKEMCKTLKATNDKLDSLRFSEITELHLNPFFALYPKDEADKIWTIIYFRFQRDCMEFNQMLNRKSPAKDGVSLVEERPKTKLNKKDCQKFFDRKDYWYIENNGDTTNLKIENGLWIDKFKDGTFSKLRVKRTSDCTFEIEFIESNNVTRKNFSRPGDKYIYQIINKEKNYYEMSAEIVEINRIEIFRMYY